MSERFTVGKTLVWRNGKYWQTQRPGLPFVNGFAGPSALDQAIEDAEAAEYVMGNATPEIGPAPSVERATS